MKFILTDHTKKRMKERGISLDEIKETYEFPDYVIKTNNKFEAHKSIRNRNIRIVYTETNNFIKIITVIEKWK